MTEFWFQLNSHLCNMDAKTQKELLLFARYFPDKAVEPCFELWKTHTFHFKITAGRRTKLGDYTHQSGKHKITVNGDQNPYAFLITYLHEVAHLLTFAQYKNKVKPHGEEWKSAYTHLLHAFIAEGVFENELHAIIKAHASCPGASSCSDPVLQKALKNFDHPLKKQNRMPCVEDLELGQLFLFQGRYFKLIEKRRSRYKAKRLDVAKYYLFNHLAEVAPVAQLPNGQLEMQINTPIPLVHIPTRARFRYENRLFEKHKQLRVNAVCVDVLDKGLYEIRSSEWVELVRA